MNCRNFRDLAYGRIAELDPRAVVPDNPDLELEKWGAAATQHASECSHCARLWCGVLIQARLLRELGRVSVPEGLAGRVVAAPHAGYREARATTSVQLLPRLQASPALARRLEGALGTKAPAVLDQLVERKLQGADWEAGRRSGLRRFTKVQAVATLALLGLALWVNLSGGSRLVAAKSPDLAGLGPYRFEIVRVNSLRDATLDPGARAWIDVLSGGLADHE